MSRNKEMYAMWKSTPLKETAAYEHNSYMWVYACFGQQRVSVLQESSLLYMRTVTEQVLSDEFSFLLYPHCMKL